jgi:hypothetical protein
MIKIKAGSEEISLRLGWGAMAHFEKQTGENVLRVIEGLQTPEKADRFASSFVILVWSMMEPRPETMEEATEIMDRMSPMALMSKVLEASEAAFEDDDAEPEDKDSKNGR